MESPNEFQEISLVSKDEEKARLNPANITLAELSQSLHATHMVAILMQAFTGHGEYIPPGHTLLQPSVYETNHALIFPPCSDNKQSQMLSNIQAVLEINYDTLHNKTDLRSKYWLFPVAEEMLFGRLSMENFNTYIPSLLKPISDRLITPRNHWVTLCYNPRSGTATVIDSMVGLSPKLYSIGAMTTLLMSGLKKYNLSVEACERVIYQGVQLDHIHCGRWTAINLLALARGKQIDELNLNKEDLAEIGPYLDKLVINGTKTPYIPVADRQSYSDTAPSSRSNSVETLSEFNNEIDDFLGKSQQICIKTACEAFQKYFDDTQARIAFFAAEESIFHNGSLLKSVDSEEHLWDILDELEKKYAHLLRSTLRTKAHSPIPTTGYTLKDPSRLGTWLEQVGMSRDEIDQLPISQVFLFNQALIYAAQTYQAAFIAKRTEFMTSMKRCLWEEKELERKISEVEEELQLKISEKKFHDLVHMALKDEIDRELKKHIKRAAPSPKTLEVGKPNAAAMERSSGSDGSKYRSDTMRPLLSNFTLQQLRLRLAYPINLSGGDGNESWLKQIRLQHILPQLTMGAAAIPRFRPTVWDRIFRYHVSNHSNGRSLIKRTVEHASQPSNVATATSISGVSLKQELSPPIDHDHGMESVVSEETQSSKSNNENVSEDPGQSPKRAEVVEKTDDNQPCFYQNHHFQLRFLQTLFAASAALAVLTILLSPLATSTLGMLLGGGLATGMMVACASASALTLGSSCYGFYARQKNNVSTTVDTLTRTF